MAPSPALFLCLCLCLCLLGGAVDPDLVRERCGGIFTAAPGLLTSHPAYGRRLHPRSLECVWRIMSPPGWRVRLFPVTLSLEAGPDCGFDRLQIFDDAHPGNASHLLATLCGSRTDSFYVSSGKDLTVVLRTDMSVNKAGFALRFVFEEQSEESPGGVVLPRRAPCGDEQALCRNGLCIPDALLCDGHNDCGDRTDESDCSANTSAPCAGESFACDPGQCIPESKVCDGRIDCANQEDEQNCEEQEDVTILRGQVKCGMPRVQHRIVGGKVARAGSWPWTVSLRQDGYHVCGGSIVSEEWIVTASHCVEGSTDERRWEVHAGRQNVDGGSKAVQQRGVARILVHPKWNSKAIDYDVTLMRLSKPLKWTKYVLPICLPSGFLKTGSKCYIAGWGDTKGTGGEGRLKQGLVKTFSRSQCNRWYGGGITARMVCAGRQKGGVDSCQGDSGGPLMCKLDGRWVLHGATSFGGECGAPNSPGVYAKVAAMRTWIAKYTKGSTGGSGSDPGSSC